MPQLLLYNALHNYTTTFLSISLNQNHGSMWTYSEFVGWGDLIVESLGINSGKADSGAKVVVVKMGENPVVKEITRKCSSEKLVHSNRAKRLKLRVKWPNWMVRPFFKCKSIPIFINLVSLYARFVHFVELKPCPHVDRQFFHYEIFNLEIFL